MITIDVISHYIWGVTLLAFAVLQAATVFNRLSEVWLNRIFGFILLLASVTYNRNFLHGIDLSFNQFHSLSASNKQHYIINILAIICAATLMIIANKSRLSNLTRAVTLVCVGIILIFHDQNHVGNEHDEAVWLLPYHRWLASLLVLTAICYFLYELTKQHQRTFYLFIAFALFLAGSTLLLYQNPSPARLSRNCLQLGTTHDVVISDDGLSKSKLDAQRCDVLHIANSSNNKHKIAFGNHEKHDIYSVHKENLIYPGQSITIILIKEGDYKLHDHLNEKLHMILHITAETVIKDKT